MESIINIVKNVKKGPITSLVGVGLCVFGGYLIYASEQTPTYMSLEAGIFFVGVVLLVSPDHKEEDGSK